MNAENQAVYLQPLAGTVSVSNTRAIHPMALQHLRPCLAGFQCLRPTEGLRQVQLKYSSNACAD